MEIVTVEEFQTRIGVTSSKTGEPFLPHVAMIFRDERGRRCTRFVAECYRPEEAKMIALALNTVLETQNPPEPYNRPAIQNEKPPKLTEYEGPLLAYADELYIRRFPQEEEVDQIEAGLNRIRVKTLRAKIERQAVQITRLEASRKGIKKWNKKLRLELAEERARPEESCENWKRALEWMILRCAEAAGGAEKT